MPICDSDAAELRDRVVAVADEDPLVELGRALALARVPRPLDLGQRVGELVEEQAPQRALIARVAGEERALHRLGQVDEREDRAVEVRHVRREARALGVGERIDRILHGAGEASARVGGRRSGRPYAASVSRVPPFGRHETTNGAGNLHFAHRSCGFQLFSQSRPALPTLEDPVVKARFPALLAVAIAAALVLAACGGADDTAGGGSSGSSSSGSSAGSKAQLSLVAYSTPQVVYDEVIPGFQKTAAGGAP